MARQLNSSHQLAANIVSLVGVDDDGVTIRDFADPARTCTPNAAVTIGTGAYGYHMQTSGSGSTALSVALSPTVQVGTLNTGPVPDFTVVMVLNKVLAGTSGAIPAFLATGGSSKTMPWIGADSAGNVIVGSNIDDTVKLTTTGGGHIDTNPLTIAVTRDSQVASELYVNGAFVQNRADGIGFSNDSNFYSQIGGYSTGGYGWRAAQVVWVIAFNKVLSATEISDLHASLGADNQISLIQSGGAGVPVAFSGPVANQVAYTNQAFSLNLTSYFSGTETPFSYTLQQGELTGSGLTLDAGGILSGTPTGTGVYSGLVVRATDTSSNVADTNAFSITVNEFNPNNPPQFIGPNIASLNVTKNTAMSSVNVSGRFSDSDALTFSPIGAWPTGVTVTSAGLISGTPTAVAATYDNLRVRATDTAAQAVDSNLFSIVIAEQAAGGDGSIVTEPLKNNTGTLLANVSGITAHVYSKVEGDKIDSLIGLMTDAAGALTITSPFLVAGTQYRVVVVLADDAEGLARYTAS